MFVKIQYQCYNVDTNEAFKEEDLKKFVEEKDRMFDTFLKEHGYTLIAFNYTPENGVRELFYKKTVSA